MQETATGKDSVGEVETLFSFLRSLGHLYTPGYSFSKVEDQKSGENLLQNQHRNFGVEMDESHRVFQTAEGDFNAPSLSIKCFQSIGRKCITSASNDRKIARSSALNALAGCGAEPHTLAVGRDLCARRL